MSPKSARKEPLSASELPPVPKDWRWVRLGEVAEIKLGKMLSRKAYAEGLVQLSYLRNLNVRWHTIDFSDLKEMGFHQKELERYLVQDGDLLVCEGGEPGRCAVYHGSDGPLMYQKALHRVRPRRDDLDPTFLQYFIARYISDPRIFPRKSETTIQHLPLEKLQDIPVSLPSPEQQKRIVARIEELFSKLDAGVAALRRARANLKRYRASVLKAAVEGRLTEDWRRRHPDVEPASRLLQRILVERRRRWGEAQTQKLAQKRGGSISPVPSQAEGHSVCPEQGRGALRLSRAKPRGTPHYKEPIGPSPEFLAQAPPLPKSWCWATVEQLTPGDRTCAYGVLQPGPDIADGIFLVRVGDINDGTIERQGMKRISRKIADQYSRTYLRGGEVLITLVGAIGRTAVAPESLAGANTARAVGVIPLAPAVNPYWSEIWLRNPATVNEMNGKAHEVARKTLNLEDVRSATIALPPRLEQDQILEEFSGYYEIAKHIEGQIHLQDLRTTALRQAILRSAFSGTPQAVGKGHAHAAGLHQCALHSPFPGEL
ncbi:MAG: restriction endonuclease subunit S [Candidatus Sumerlaeota bacterium]|nr:restriction endonuclease subunit S [Candidatus Sumerlaeota bacterium]